MRKVRVNNSDYEFIQENILNNFINVKNRQTIINYGSLRFLYEDYYKKTFETDCCSDNYEIFSLNNDVVKYEAKWFDLISQVIPSTTVLNAIKIVRNPIFLREKYEYKSYNLQTCGDITICDDPNDAFCLSGYTYCIEDIENVSYTNGQERLDYNTVAGIRTGSTVNTSEVYVKLAEENFLDGKCKIECNLIGCEEISAIEISDYSIHFNKVHYEVDDEEILVDNTDDRQILLDKIEILNNN